MSVVNIRKTTHGVEGQGWKILVKNLGMYVHGINVSKQKLSNCVPSFCNQYIAHVRCGTAC